MGDHQILYHQLMIRITVGFSSVLKARTNFSARIVILEKLVKLDKSDRSMDFYTVDEPPPRLLRLE